MRYEIAVIIPVYNVKDYLGNALDSILNQTMDLSKIQVILVDDASDDGSEKIIDYYCENHANFYSIHLEDNTGSPAIPRNIGIDYSDARYIMFLDPDDEFSEDYCEVMYDSITAEQVDIVKCNSIRVGNENIFYDYYFDKSITKKLIKNSDEPLRLVSVWNGIHDVNLIKNNNIQFPNLMGEDIPFSVNEFLCMDSMIFLNDYFGYIYYDRYDSHAKSPNGYKIYSVMQSFEYAKNICLKVGRNDVIFILLGQQIQSLFSRIAVNNESIKCKIKLLKKLYDIEKDIELKIPGISFRIVNFFLLKRCFYLALFSLIILNKLYSSNKFFKIIYMIKNRN